MALNGIDPIIIFQLYKLTPKSAATLAALPLTSQAKEKTTFAVIPLYLDEKVSGIAISSESKNIDINTDMESLTSGGEPLLNQKTLGSITTINLTGKRDSLGLTLLLALSELLLDKVTSQEYEMTYMHEATVVFGGLIHSFSYAITENTDKYEIKLEISRGRPKSKSVLVMEDPTAARLGSAGATPPAGAPTVSGTPAGNSGTSLIQPGAGAPIGGVGL